MGWNTIHAKKSDRYIAVKCFGGTVGVNAGIISSGERLFSADLTPEETGELAVFLFEAVEEIYPEALDGKLLRMMGALDDEERTALFSKFCVHCGSDSLPCHCWNDE